MGAGDIVLTVGIGALLLFFAVRFWRGDLGLMSNMDEEMLRTMDDGARRQTSRVLAGFLGLVFLICLFSILGPQLAR